MAPLATAAPFDFGKYNTNYGSSHLPEDRDQALVQTPYGKGMVIRTRKTKNSSNKQKKKKDEDVTAKDESGEDTDITVMREIELLDWKKPEVSKTTATTGPQKPSMLYTSTKFPSIEPEVGSEVTTAFGRGKVIEIRSNEAEDANDGNNNNYNSTLVVQISSWRLAKRSKVTCYLSPRDVQVVRPAKVYEMSSYDKVEYAQELKQKATTEYFSNKLYKEALELYEKAVECVRYVQHTTNSTNELRADLLVVMITCCNNAATCCLHDELKYCDRAIKFGQNAIILLDALYEKKGNSQILKVLNLDGYPDVQLFGTWKIKSYIVIGRGYIESGEYDKAIKILKTGLDTVTAYKNPPGRNNRNDPNRKYQKQLQSQEKELRRYMVSCKEKLKLQKQKEKKRALAMFGGGGGGNNNNANEAGGDNVTTSSTSPPSSEEKKDIDEGTSRAVSVPAAAGGSAEEEATKSVNGGSNNGSPANEGAALSSSLPSSPRKPFERRVSFADGSRPGDKMLGDDDDDDGFFGGFFDEHKEALVVVGGVMVGSFLLNLLLNVRGRR